MDLDKLILIRLALLLRGSLPKNEGISRRTISRLLVLTYLVVGLAEERDCHVIIKNTNQSLKVANVELTLQRAGIE